MGERGDLLMFRAPNKDLDELCAHFAAAETPDLGPAYAARAVALREHFEGLGVRAVALAVAVVRSGSKHGFTDTIATRHAHDAPPTSAAIEEWIAGAALVHAPDALVDSRLAAPLGTTIVDAPVVDGSPPGVIVRPPPERLVPPFALSATEARALRSIVEHGSVRAATDWDRAELLSLASELVRRGALAPA
jgi:hypothetical protein